MSIHTFNAALCHYLDSSPTPFHAVSQARQALVEAGFECLHEADSWQLEEGKSYFLTRNDSSLIAFHYAKNDWATEGCRLVGAHSDSPCLKLKPNAVIKRDDYLKFGVEVYGGVLLNPWFDRDLSLAGRLVVEDEQGRQQYLLIDFDKAIAIIPSLAIHLDREANQNRSINAQTDIHPLFMQLTEDAEQASLEHILLAQARKQYPDLSLASVLDFELSFYDTQKAASVGLHEQFIASARLDNLLSCFAALRALCESSGQAERQNALMVINDHEEVGSQTAQGAQGTFLSSVIERICGNHENSARCLSRSMMISADNAHGIHPNFPDKHDAQHGPILNKGLVIKLNANQRYATNSVTSARLKQMARAVNMPTQSFVVRSDMGCGSTIGPLSAAELGVQTIDVGVPTFAMHSIRETAGSKDAYDLYRLLAHFFTQASIYGN